MYGGFSGIVSDATAVAITGGVGIGTFVAMDQIASRVPFLAKHPRITAGAIAVVGTAGGIALHRYVHSGVGMGFAAGSVVYGGAKLVAAFVPQLAPGSAQLPAPPANAPGQGLLAALRGRGRMGGAAYEQRRLAPRSVSGVATEVIDSQRMPLGNVSMSRRVAATLS